MDEIPGEVGHRPGARFMSKGHRTMKNMLLVVLICTALYLAERAYCPHCSVQFL
jgi:hypothetical protein